MRGWIIIAVCVLVVLCCTADAGADDLPEWRVHPDYTLIIASRLYGIADHMDVTTDDRWTYVYLGPLGRREVPFTARQGLVGAIAIPILIAFLVYGVIRLITRRAHSEGADDAGRS